MWAGSLDPAHALVLAEQLKHVPDSRVRAKAAGSTALIGWGVNESISADIADLILAGIYANAGKRVPSSARYPRPEIVSQEEEKMTIADFSPDAFLRKLNS